jgi:hypothetical protein
MWHASQHNATSVGIEAVNPYDPKLMPPAGPWSKIIDAPWAAGGKYVVPTPAQVSQMWRIARGPIRRNRKSCSISEPPVGSSVSSQFCPTCETDDISCGEGET